MSLIVPGKGYTVTTTPGQAQPKQPQSQGTPYGPGGFSAYAPQNSGMSQDQRQQAMTAWTMPKQDLMQWGQSLPRGQGQQPQQGMDPNQVWGRNAAIVDQINRTSANQQVGTYLGQGAPPPGWGQTNYNPQQMIGTANQMMQQGWQNPFAPPMQDAAAGVRELLQGYGQQGTPGYGTPPALRGGIRGQMFDDKDGDGVDDRDQDGPGMPHYARPGQAQPTQDPYGSASRPTMAGSPPPAASPGWQQIIDANTEILRSGPAWRAEDARQQIAWARNSQRREQEYLTASAGYDPTNPEAAKRVRAVIDKHQREDSAKLKASRPPASPSPQGVIAAPAPSPRPLSRAGASPAKPRNAALPASMAGVRWERRPDGSYVPAGTPGPPQQSFMGDMSPEGMRMMQSGWGPQLPPGGIA